MKRVQRLAPRKVWKFQGRLSLLLLISSGLAFTSFSEASRAALFAAPGSNPAAPMAAIAGVRSVKFGLNGGGIRVAQVEATESTNALAFEVNPLALGQPDQIFTYVSDQGRRAGYPNSVGAESSHADGVAGYFYGFPSGMATNVPHVDNWEAQHFFAHVISAVPAPGIPDRIVNQSWIFQTVTTDRQEAIDSLYDAYAVRHKVLFVSAVGNGGPVSPPATCYNGIAVAAYGGSSSAGPTADNGRSKPDISAPASETSFAAPQVAGAAAILAQAALRGDGGKGSRAAADIRALKALLLNGSVKPADWTHSPGSPLDFRYGAGICNFSNSYRELLAGKHGSTASNKVAAGDPHPPVLSKRIIQSWSGFDLSLVSSSARLDGLRDYEFSVVSATNAGAFTATATLVWNRRPGRSAASNLDLFLYDADSGALVSSSTSVVDNVEHLFVAALPQGNYALQVRKAGGSGQGGSETYALAFEFTQGR